MIAEAESIRGPSAYQPNALPLGQTGPHRRNLREQWFNWTRSLTIIELHAQRGQLGKHSNKHTAFVFPVLICWAYD